MRQESLQHVAPLTQVPSSHPESPQGSPQTQGLLPLLCTPSRGRLEDGSQVIQFLFRPIKPQQLFGTQEMRLGLLSKLQVVVRMGSLCCFQFTLLMQAF